MTQRVSSLTRLLEEISGVFEPANTGLRITLEE